MDFYRHNLLKSGNIQQYLFATGPISLKRNNLHQNIRKAEKLPISLLAREFNALF